MHKQALEQTGAAVASIGFPMSLPVTQFLLDAELDDRLRATSGAEPRSAAVAHPVLGFVVALGGGALPVAQVLARCGCSIDAGPLLASCDIEWEAPLLVGQTYQVESEVSAKQRKSSRRFGAADHLTLRFTVTLDAIPRVRVRLHMIVPAIPA